MSDLRVRLQSGLADQYAVERELGRGGMATVFLARDLKHDRPVALKVLHAEIASSLGSERFQREIKFAARLQHPHILGVHDSGVIPAADGDPASYWFTMPYVEGESLRERLRREKQLPLDEALRITREAADALDYAHRHGVIHRDIKPENILLSGSHALVADFGVARALDLEEAGSVEGRITGTGVAIGTPTYMSPEQASGERRVDARADVYALGAVLYEMLAGEPPFTGPTPQAVIARLLTETPRPIRSTRDSVPPGVDLAIGKALARAPADRFATAGQFVAALDEAVQAAQRSGEQPSGAGRARRKAPPAATLFVLGLLIGVGVLFAWRRSRGGGEADGASARTIAVLPFENQGAQEDQYFADGMTDEVRGRLSTLPGLQVIARGSSNQYRKTDKSQEQIARELGARYLLTATVRWEKQSAGQSRVRVTPELVEVGDGSAPHTRWTQPFDAVLSDVFQVQGDIATKVAQALDVALASGEKRRLEARPTQNLAAYDAYLQGNETGPGSVSGPAGLERAAGLYGRAVALDSTFLLAWAQQSRTNSQLYWLVSPRPEFANAAKTAAERALALDPNGAAAHFAMGDYHRYVQSDWPKAIEQYTIARRGDPQNGEILSQIAFAQQSAGRWEDALKTVEEGIRVDPRSALTRYRLSRAYLWLRRYPEALAAADNALALNPAAPQAIENKAMVYLAQGDLAGARGPIRAAPRELDPTALVAYFANYWDLYWVLDDEHQQLLLRLPMAPFANDRPAWTICIAQTYFIRGDLSRARVYADSATIANEAVLRDSPNDGQRHAFRGLALAMLGQKAEAIREGERAVELVPMNRDAYTGVYLLYLLARIYAIAGEPDRAIDKLDTILRVPFYVSAGWLRIDPEWNALRGNRRFQTLVGGK